MLKEKHFKGSTAFLLNHICYQLVVLIAAQWFKALQHGFITYHL